MPIDPEMIFVTDSFCLRYDREILFSVVVVQYCCLDYSCVNRLGELSENYA